MNDILFSDIFGYFLQTIHQVNCSLLLMLLVMFFVIAVGETDNFYV